MPRTYACACHCCVNTYTLAHGHGISSNSVRKNAIAAAEKKKKEEAPKQMYVYVSSEYVCSLRLPWHSHTLVCPFSSDQIPSNLFFKYNAELGPPYNVLIDTNFINFSIKNKLEVVSAMMDCLLAKCTSVCTGAR